MLLVEGIRGGRQGRGLPVDGLQSAVVARDGPDTGEIRLGGQAQARQSEQREQSESWSHHLQMPSARPVLSPNLSSFTSNLSRMLSSRLPVGTVRLAKATCRSPLRRPLAPPISTCGTS